MISKIKINTVEEYIAGFGEDVQLKLQQIRHTIIKAVPAAEELISYGMPAYKYHVMLIYFAAYKNHIGFYATPTGHEAFKKELAVYKEGYDRVSHPMKGGSPG